MDDDDPGGRLVRAGLAEGLARRTLDIARREPLPAERLSWNDLPWDDSPTDSQRATMSRWHELTVRVHADWPMTPREDLDGQPPRHFLHRGRDWVEHELHNREMQWSNEGCCPRPLDRDMFAYRHGPLGRHEVVMYFDLCRELLRAAWDRIAAEPEVVEDALTKALREAGLSSPWPVMGFAMPVAELVGNLKVLDGSRELIEALNMAFDTYCAADGDRSLSAAAAAQLAETLEQIAAAHPPLTPKAADLQSQLAERERQTESDVPF